ncbi:MAG: antitoxin [Ilumatobacteraceae bacterium]
MTMLSFRVEEHVSEEVNGWCRRLGIDRSTLLRESLRLHIARLRSEHEAERLTDAPPSDGLAAFDEITTWLPQEDWTAWVAAADAGGDDAAR